MWTLTMVPYSISVHMCIVWHQTVNDNVEFIRLHVHCALLLCFKIYEKCGQMHIFTILSYGNYLSGKFCDEIIIFTQILSAVSGNLAFSLLFLF